MLSEKKETAVYHTNSPTYTHSYSIPYSRFCTWLDCQGINQEKLASIMGKSRPTICKYNTRDLWTLADVKKLAHILGLPFEEVACRMGKVEPQTYTKDEFKDCVDKEVSRRLQEAIGKLVEVYR